MHKRLVLLALMCGPLLSAGCASGGLEPVRPQGVLRCGLDQAARAHAASGPALAPLVEGAFSPIPLESVQFLDPETARTVAVQAVVVQRTSTGTVRVVGRFVNCSGSPAQLLARTSFLSDGTAPSEPTSAWRRIYLEGRASAVYDEVSTSRQVRHYLIEAKLDR
jgi:hypothetical protein